ncbi:MFS transporter [Priestia megaterium]|uniref:MFS transporter n=1 Tax=Priestia megaterium TaxID=1404 RepID=UPI000BF5B45C|nr:MFS transporter [Priestia megaterium]PET69464.1 MFS transporter [Priestia megaterium]PFK82773.1 MFS transporter [Priestia megaterium]
MSYIERGTNAFKRVNLALFAGGFSTFAILWGTQPLLPEISKELQVSPATSSLVLSSTTIALAISMLISGSLSEVFGRKSIMALSLALSSILSILTALSPDFHLLILTRVLQGIVLAGLPAVAMAYLGEEIEPKSLGIAMGLYISGNSIGGMSGRIISGILTDYINWHAGLIGIGIITLISSFIFCLLLPPSANFTPKKLMLKPLMKSLISHLKEPALICIFIIGFLVSSIFASLYNYIGFELIKPPYNLSQTLVGFIFIVYIVGTFSSTWMGSLSDTHGRGKILYISLFILLTGSCITLNTTIWIKILGIAVFTFGFFASHSIASGWVGKVSTHDKAQASSLYLFFYYGGSSINGTASGLVYSNLGWNGLVTLIASFSVLAIGTAACLVSITTKKSKYVNRGVLSRTQTVNKREHKRR